MCSNSIGFLGSLLLAALTLLAPGPASAATDTEAGEPGAEGVTIEIGSTYSFGPTPVGNLVSRSFQLINKDTARPMRIYGFWISQNFNQPTWAILEKPGEDEWLPPGATAELEIQFIASKPGEHKADVSWYVEMKPFAEGDEDNFFVFTVRGEALEGESPER